MSPTAMRSPGRPNPFGGIVPQIPTPTLTMPLAPQNGKASQVGLNPATSASLVDPSTSNPYTPNNFFLPPTTPPSPIPQGAPASGPQQQQPYLQQPQWTYLPWSGPLPQNVAQNMMLSQQQPQYSPSDWLAQNAQNNQYLVNFAQNGQPVNAMPAWQSYVNAMQRNIGEGAANLQELFNSGGTGLSTSFGNASVDYMTQANAQQNALLAQMGYQSLSDATNRQYGASQMLGQQAYGGASQLAGQDFQSQMAQYNNSLQAAMMMGQGAYGAANTLGGYGNSAVNTLLANSLAGTNSLFGASNNAAQNMYSTSMGLLPSMMSYDSTIRGQNVSGAGTLGNLYQGNLGLGNTLGTSQYGTLQQQLSAAYQEWMRQQPEYNPLLPYLYSASTGYTPSTAVSTPSLGDYLTQILGAGIIGAGSLLGGIYSDVRLKENLVPLGRLADVNFYEFNYKGLPGRQVGVLAQEVVKTHPLAVIPGNDSRPWLVNYEQLARELMLRGGVN